MDYEEALDFLHDYLYGTPCDDRGYLEMLELSDDIHPGDRVLEDTRILRAKDYLRAKSVINGIGYQQEAAPSGRQQDLTLAKARAYALALFQHADLTKDSAADQAADKYSVNRDSVRRYLNKKDKDSPP